MTEVIFKNKFLNRILKLTEKGEIKWKRTETVAKNCIRFLGIGINHKFVIVEYEKHINYKMDDYVGYVSKQITDVENSWEFVFDRFSEIEKFIIVMKNIIEPDEDTHKSGIYSVESNDNKNLYMLERSILNDDEYNNSEVWDYMKEYDYVG